MPKKEQKKFHPNAVIIIFIIHLVLFLSVGIAIGSLCFAKLGFPEFKSSTSLVITNSETKTIAIYHSDKREWFLVGVEGEGKVTNEKTVIELFSATKQTPKEIKKNG